MLFVLGVIDEFQGKLVEHSTLYWLLWSFTCVDIGLWLMHFVRITLVTMKIRHCILAQEYADFEVLAWAFQRVDAVSYVTAEMQDCSSSDCSCWSSHGGAPGRQLGF